MNDQPVHPLPLSKPLHAHWDCFGGLSTDCIVTACVDALDSPKHAQEIVQQAFSSQGHLNVLLKTQRVRTCGLAARNLTQLEASSVRDGTPIFDLDSLELPSRVKDTVRQVFSAITGAEAAVRGVPTSTVTLDACTRFEILCSVFLLHHLGVETVSCGPIPLGHGSTFSYDDGLIPIPSPTALQLLLGMKTYPGPPQMTNTELVTAGGAAVMRILVKTSASTDVDESIDVPSSFSPIRVGVGAGGSDSPLRLRLLLGTVETDRISGRAMKRDGLLTPLSQSTPSLWNMETLTEFEANLDDMTAEALAFAVELLFRSGASDAWITPIVMKKGRAAHTLHCLCRSSLIDGLLELVFRHTTTLGVRLRREVARAALNRKLVPIETIFRNTDRKGVVCVKLGYLGSEVVSVKPEFDHCREISVETGVPINLVSDSAAREAWNLIKNGSLPN